MALYVWDREEVHPAIDQTLTEMEGADSLEDRKWYIHHAKDYWSSSNAASQAGGTAAANTAATTTPTDEAPCSAAFDSRGYAARFYHIK